MGRKGPKKAGRRQKSVRSTKKESREAIATRSARRRRGAIDERRACQKAPREAERVRFETRRSRVHRPARPQGPEGALDPARGRKWSPKGPHLRSREAKSGPQTQI